jgi:hypothetical protein
VRAYFREESGSYVYKLKDAPFTLLTPAGKQRTLVTDIRQIRFARRDPSTGAIVSRKPDTVHTAEGTLTGTLEGRYVDTHYPGSSDPRIPLAALKKLVALTKEQARKADTFEAPETLITEGGGYGQKRLYRVVGSKEGRVYGTGLYALSSNFGAAAVHAGRVRAGKRGVVEVEIIPSPPRFEGPTQNGVTSEPAGAYPGAAFRFLEPEDE